MMTNSHAKNVFLILSILVVVTVILTMIVLRSSPQNTKAEDADQYKNQQSLPSPSAQVIKPLSADEFKAMSFSNPIQLGPNGCVNYPIELASTDTVYLTNIGFSDLTVSFDGQQKSISSNDKYELGHLQPGTYSYDVKTETASYNCSIAITNL